VAFPSASGPKDVVVSIMGIVGVSFCGATGTDSEMSVGPSGPKVVIVTVIGIVGDSFCGAMVIDSEMSAAVS